MTGRRSRASLMATVAVLAASGCGTGHNSDKPSFISQANAICAQGNAAVRVITAAIKEAQRGSNPDKVFNQLSSLTRRGASTFLPYLDRLDGLTPPAGDRDKLKAWIASQRRQLALVDSLSSALKAQDTAGIARLSEQIDALAQTNNSFAKQYGMTECSKTS